MRFAFSTSFVLVAAFAAAALACVPTAQAADETRLPGLKSKQIYMVEERSGTVLLAQNENQAFPPASLAKLMTMDLVFEALAQGEVTLDTTYRVSENAWRTGGAPSGTTTMFAALRSEIRLEDLIKGVIIHNANDACIIIAEGVSGSEQGFAARMTARARDLGLSRSLYANATGLPEGESRTTVRDLVELARHIRRTYPQFYPLYAQPDFEWNKIFQRNKNPFLSLGMGIDGLGAGYAEGAGFAGVASIERDGTRLFLALAGLSSDKDRLDEARRVLEWGLSSFTTRVLFAEGETVGQATVYGGDHHSVNLSAKGPIEVYIPSRDAPRLSGRIVYRWPLKAPVSEGQEVGVLKVFEGERPLKEVPLYAASAVASGSLVSKATDALMELLLFWL
ncbi:D-alanyl-D-alanine carboxypeptidase (penicillin-binding protein 5/6) [Neorhizobium galegae]|uniref:D-alanyl-D-alanine carboxypeptidase family protein n=1 Tax=Neorhizobium galegae TaxID=399 RepID=UPI001AE64949|nr:D-alanyl-D-alanine carboxypeptidase family protein [Neorhizobium galegae]MBP2549556.1 D-alanyl-D-alanine carboxypeptidase (penicillin-binding protein 5/6) [Neorhizobium galegae]